MSAQRVAFAFGGGSELGIAFTKEFKDANYEVCSVDVFDSPTCDHSLCLPPGAPPRAQLNFATKMISDSFSAERPFDIMFNCTIGYSLDTIGEDTIFDSVEYMMRTNVDTTLVTARLASRYLKPGGLLVFLGSVAAFSSTKQVGYSSAKAALHQIVRSLALSVGDELPEGVRVFGIVPEVLDVSLHRNINGGKAESNWTPPEIVTSKLLSWSEGKSSPPENGSLVAVTSEEIQISEGQTARQHLFRLIETPSFIQKRLL